MRGSWRSAVGFAVVCGWLLTFTTVVRAEQVAASDCAGAPWMDPTKSPDERATLVIAQMTLDEKIQEMGSLRDAEHFRETPPIPRLCVPALRLNNGSAGVSTGGPVQFPATALPAPIGLAATWDPQQALQYGTVQGQETLDQGRNLLEGPDINIARVPVNGRTFEAYGEDPFLAGQTTVGDVRQEQCQRRLLVQPPGAVAEHPQGRVGLRRVRGLRLRLLPRHSGLCEQRHGVRAAAGALLQQRRAQGGHRRRPGDCGDDR